ncbi:MAG: sugar transferase [Sphingomonadales bacterium]|nr:sugar transferase [Sphingomonadales bacterium]MBU3991286.1 sugar transferase [Alphaproteobacteria bacterium]
MLPAGPDGVTGLGAALKRAFDIAFAASFLAVALPFMLLLAAALQVNSPGRLFFVQRRIGHRGRTFRCIKFRTMRADAARVLAETLAACPAARREWAADHKLRDDPRVSGLGKVVRKLSLDELPQLINILRGEMSVVGPRPIVVAEIAKYGPRFADYCAVKPGLTGLWQISGRNDVSYAQRVDLDRQYRLRASFLFDLRIVLRTIPAVLGASGSY